MEKMLVTKALNELNLLDSRINKAISKGGFVTAAKAVEKKVSPYQTKEEFANQASETYQSIVDLIDRRAKIKAAIVHSNAVTNVTIGGITMTVAEAIEKKTSIEYEHSFFTKMKNEYEAAVSKMNTQNTIMEDKIDNNISTLLGKEGKASTDEVSSMTKIFREANQWSLVDPLNVKKKVESLEASLEAFYSEVDSALQISNCITEIEF